MFAGVPATVPIAAPLAAIRQGLQQAGVHPSFYRAWCPAHASSPLWAPLYLMSCMQVHFKPQAKRMQMEVPLNKKSAEYNADADPSAQVETIRLDSTVVDMRTTHAVLTIRQACPSHADRELSRLA